jgi:hypothetical protein
VVKDWEIKLAQQSHRFQDAVNQAIDFAFSEIEKETVAKQLYYHTYHHACDVRRRANVIFEALLPFMNDIFKRNVSDRYLTRLKSLINLCAVAHDFVQEFIPDVTPHTSRKRESGVNEEATASKLIDYLDSLERQEKKGIFTKSDKDVIRESVLATICRYDAAQGDLYQPRLHAAEQAVSLPARILALADLGGLGMEGIDYYLKEGRLITLEENPDIISIVLHEEQALFDNLRQRLLQRAHFQVNLARGRESRFMREVAGLPAAAIAVLKNNIFRYLTPETIATLEALIPTADDTPLQILIEFFELNKPDVPSDALSPRTLRLPC